MTISSGAFVGHKKVVCAFQIKLLLNLKSKIKLKKRIKIFLLNLKDNLNMFKWLICKIIKKFDIPNEPTDKLTKNRIVLLLIHFFSLWNTFAFLFSVPYWILSIQKSSQTTGCRIWDSSSNPNWIYWLLDWLWMRNLFPPKEMN